MKSLILLLCLAFAVPAYAGCYSNNQYTVCEQSLTPNIGNNYIITYHSKPYLKILNGDNALYFAYLYKNILILDDGTGPDIRGFHVYNLDKKIEVMQSQYYKDYDFQGNQFYYWLLKNNADVKTCPDYQKDLQNGLTPVILEKYALNLDTLKSIPTGESRCDCTQ